MDNIETRLKALEYELSQIVDSDYLNELNKYPNKDLQKDLVINIIPSKDISFRTRALLSDILDRLELSRQDRQDLEKYIIYGGGENIEYIKSTIGDLLNKVPELNYLIDNIQTVIPLLNRLDELFKDADESLDSFKELYNTLNSLKNSINNLNNINIKQNNDIKNIGSLLNNIDKVLTPALNDIDNIKQTINDDVLLKKDSPFEKGSADNSAVLKGGNNQVISERGVAIGNNTFVGQKAYRFTSCNIAAKRFAMIASLDEVSTNFAVGDIVSIINDKKYPNCATISLISKGSGGKALITVDTLPFDSIVDDDGFDAKLIYVSAKPESGNIDLGVNAYAEGENTCAQNWDAHAEGRDTHAYGEYSHAEGRETSAQYAAHSEGLRTTASGNQSHAEGQGTIAKGISSHAEGHMTEAKGDHSHAEGIRTHSYGVNSHAEGIYCYAWGNNSHAEGYYTASSSEGSHAEGYETSATAKGSHAEGFHTIANGDGAHAEGYHTVTYNDYEHAQGKYNKNNKGTIHSVGIGASNIDRKNAHEIMQDGKHYIYGIGGYDGTNAVTANAQGVIAKSVQEVINELVDIISQITIKVE